MGGDYHKDFDDGLTGTPLSDPNTPGYIDGQRERERRQQTASGPAWGDGTGKMTTEFKESPVKFYVKWLGQTVASKWRAVVERLTEDMRIETEARAALQRRFFGGHDVLFADAGQAWAEHVDLVERLSGLAEVTASTGKPTTRGGRNRTAVTGSVDALVAARATRLADDARVRAYEILGDRPRAVAIMERRLLGDSDSRRIVRSTATR